MYDLEVDQPSFRASFLPMRSFDEHAPLFTDYYRAWDEKRYDDVNRLTLEIRKLRVSIEDEDGQLHYSSDPNLRPIKSIAAVRIKAREICFRPLD